MSQSAVFPETPFASVEQLDWQLSTPTPGVLKTFQSLSGDILILGVGGKMGPTLARMAKRAAEEVGSTSRIIGVSRFSDTSLMAQLQDWGIETITCDLLDEKQVAQLPDAPIVISMAGFKFGAASNPSLAWAMNCYLPALVCRRFRTSRIIAFSSGNIYGLVPVNSGGSVETDQPRPVGEYAMTILGRERMFDYFSREYSIPVTLLRLNYATELRYGVLVDIGLKVWQGQPIDLAMSYVNVIWQSEANAMSLQALERVATPASIINIAGHEILRVREVAEQFGRLLSRPPGFTGEETSEALINNAAESHRMFGRPQISADSMIRSTAEWIQSGGPRLNKATHFQSRDGQF